MGKASALVVDVGAGCTTTVPVHDGFMLRGGLRRTKIAGDSLDAFVEDAVFNKQQREIVPSYMFKRELGSMGKHVNKKLSLKNTTSSYERYMKRQVAQSVKESICRISEQPFNLLQNTNIPKEKYELPDGNVIEMGSDRFTIGENLFRPSSEFLELAGPDFEGQPQFEGLHQMVASSIDACDVDVRKELYNHILLTGASTCIVGTDKRLIADLNRNLTPAFRVKLLGAPVERRFGSWTGGSILGSLGSFHQMWVSKAEYEEKGAALLAQKCP
jgi:actin-like protein 6A